MRWIAVLFLVACEDDEPVPVDSGSECCVLCAPGTVACGDDCVWISNQEECFPEPPPGCACDFEEAGGPDGFNLQ